MVNRKKLFDTIRQPLFKGKLSQPQVDGIETILKACDKWKIADPRWIAYILGTTYHETAKTMQPIEEYGKGKGKPYGGKIDVNGKPYTTPDKLYFGRGYVQITWLSNYKKMGKILSLPLAEQPELALISGIAADIMLEGMTKGKSSFGDFTGKSLEDYFNAHKTDWVGARVIINGKDKAEKIAKESQIFYKGLI